MYYFELRTLKLHLVFFFCNRASDFSRAFSMHICELFTFREMGKYLYQFLVAAVTNYHQPGGLVHQKLIFSQFWRPEVQMQNQSVGGPCHLQRVLGRVHPCPFQFLVLVFIPWFVVNHSNPCLCGHIFFCLWSNLPLYPSQKDIQDYIQGL